MEEKINELTSLAYKNKFSLYYQPGECLVRTYFRDGTQHKETGETMMVAITRMLDFLKNQGARDASFD